jgi:hypothetical protein
MAIRKDEELTTDDKFMLLLEALNARRGSDLDAETLEKLLAGQATAMKKALRPENDEHPGHAALAYPEGDKAKPREGILSHEFFYNGFPVHKFPENHAWYELEMAEKVQPGEYRVILKDMTDKLVTVKGETNAKGIATKVSVEFGVSREEKGLIPPMYVLLYQLVHPGQSEQRFVEAMHAYLDLVIRPVAA